MRVLFIVKDFYIEPLGIMYLSTALKAANHFVDIVTTNEDVFTQIKEFKPDIVAYSTTTGSQDFFLKLNREIKERFDTLSIMGGAHPTFFPEVIEEPGLDIVCLGEGEASFVELVNRLEAGRDITKIENLWIKRDGVVYKNEVRPLVKNLDSIAFPDRELVHKYDQIRQGPIKHFIASRGCPYNCTYCFNHSYFELYKQKRRQVRFRSVDNTLTEIAECITRYPTKLVYFQDDTFILDKIWLREFCTEYSKRIGLPFHCHVRANLVDEETVSLLKEAGCYSVHMAIEAADDFVRNEILKRAMSKEAIYNAATLLNKYRIKIMLQNMLGLPGSSLAKDLETLKLNIECRPQYAWVSIFQPYPRTEIAEFCKEQGLYDGNPEAIQERFFDSSILKLQNKREIENLQKWFALAVRFPIIFRSGLLKLLIKVPRFKLVNWLYSWLYTTYRRRSDNSLYGVKL